MTGTTRCHTCAHPHREYIDVLLTRFAAKRILEILKMVDPRLKESGQYKAPSTDSINRHKRKNHNRYARFDYIEYAYDFFASRNDVIAKKIRNVLANDDFSDIAPITMNEATFRVRQNVTRWREAIRDFDEQLSAAKDVMRETDDERIKLQAITTQKDIRKEMNKTLELISKETRLLMNLVQRENIEAQKAATPRTQIMNVLGTQGIAGLLAIQKTLEKSDFNVREKVPVLEELAKLNAIENS